jgi:hypothetical protein
MKAISSYFDFSIGYETDNDITLKLTLVSSL